MLMLAGCDISREVAQTHFSDGNNYYGKGEFIQAISEFSLALKKGKKQSFYLNAWQLRSSAYFYSGDLKNAIEDCEDILRAFPNDVLSISNLASYQHLDGNYHGSDNYCNSLLELTQDTSYLEIAFYMLAMNSFRRESYDTAVHWSTKLIELQPTHIHGRRLRAQSFYRSDHFSEAMSDINTCINADSLSWDAWQLRVMIRLATLKEFSSAQDTIDLCNDIYRVQLLGSNEFDDVMMEFCRKK